MVKKIKIGLIQSKSLGTIQSNIDLAIKNIKKAAKKKAKIICLPELFLTNYFCQTAVSYTHLTLPTIYSV